MSEKLIKKVLKDTEKNEKFLKIIRKSILAYFLNTFSDVFLLFIGGILIYFGWTWIIYGDLKFHLTEFIVLILWFLLIFIIWFYFWYNTYLLVTTHRIEKHKLNYLLGDEKEILWYKEINKISFSYPSLVAKFLSYGNLEIMAGETEKNNIIFEQAPTPEKLVKYLRGLKKNTL